MNDDRTHAQIQTLERDVNSDLLTRLRALSPLGTAPAGKRCKICSSLTNLFDVVDFNKHCSSEPYCLGLAAIAVHYYRCDFCDFTFTDLMDDWTADDMAAFIYNGDYLKVDSGYSDRRPVHIAYEMATKWLRGCEHLRILDYGSGSGKFAMTMMDLGFAQVESYDPFSSPSRPSGKFDIITAFEVMEHLCDPMHVLADICELLSGSGAAFVGVSLQPENFHELRGQWWYIGPRNGHISTYSDLTFSTMATLMSLAFHRGTGGIHAFARPHPLRPIQDSLERIGPRFQAVNLSAPLGQGEPGWHGIERSGTRAFRWSATRDLVWPNVMVSASSVSIRIPFLNEIQPGFAAKSVATIDGHEMQTTVRSRTIRADLSPNETCTHSVELVTPEPVSPRSVRGSADDRALGIAVMARIEINC